MNKLLEHFKRMQAQALSYIHPEKYEPLNRRLKVGENEHVAFAADMVYMLDGPEQRAAQAAAQIFGLDVGFVEIQLLHRKFKTPAPEVPTMQTPELVERRAKWIASELEELFDSVTIAQQADAYLDIIVFALGGLVELGVRPQRAFELVMASQWAKVWPDGEAHIREDGKWIKPEGWIAPDAEIEAEVNRQIAESVDPVSQDAVDGRVRPVSDEHRHEPPVNGERVKTQFEGLDVAAGRPLGGEAVDIGPGAPRS